MTNKQVTSSFARTDEEIQQTTNKLYPQPVLSGVGSAPDVILADTVPTTTTLIDGQPIQIELSHAANATTTPTAQIGSSATKTIVRQDGSALEIGDTGARPVLSYSLSIDKFILMNPVSASELGGELPDFYLNNGTSGLRVVINVTDPSHDIDIEPGKILDSTGTFNMNLTSTLTKRLDANWSEGNNGGAFPSSLTVTINTWYRIILIAKTDGTVDWGYDTDGDATNLLADATGFTLRRRIGWAMTDAANNLRLFFSADNDAKRYVWDVPTSDLAANASTIGSNITVTAPPSTSAILNISYGNNGAINYFYVSEVTQTNTVPSATVHDIRLQSDGSFEVFGNVIKTVTATSTSTVRERATAANPSLINTQGWIDNIGSA